MRTPAHRIFTIKCVTRLLPYHCEKDGLTGRQVRDELLEQSTLAVDLGTLFWQEKLDQSRLESLLSEELHSKDAPLGNEHQLDRESLRQLANAKSIFASTRERMPGPDELWFAYRVLTRAISIGTRHEVGFELHMARGIITNEYRQFVLADILRAAADPLSCSFGRQALKLLSPYLKSAQSSIVVINLRNDGEFNQALVLASICKSLLGDNTIVIIDTSDANEQFDFGSWVPLFQAQRDVLSPFINYFLPRQDYKSTLRALLRQLQRGEWPVDTEVNLLPFKISATLSSHLARQIGGGQKPTLTPSDVSNIRPSLDDAFESFLRTRRVFLAAGKRTLLARISPNRCHWAACSFCTINAQHLLPRAGVEFDGKAIYFADLLLDVVREQGVESLILMDEALPPSVLIGFAQKVVDRNVRIVYRARARFTKELTPDICNLLYTSGCRYLGLGLESATPRVNRMVNKHLGDTPDYQMIIDSLENAGIRSHIYCIMGFPTETKEEISATYEFVSKNIEKHPYVTVSANLFYLMKGSEIWRDPASFGISETREAGELALAVDFDEPQRSTNQGYAFDCAKQLYNMVFLPHVKDPSSAEGYWHFVDQTGIFYLEKVHYAENPYHTMANAAFCRCEITINSRLKASFVFEILSARTAETRVLCDWVTLNYLEVPHAIADFVLQLDQSLPLGDMFERITHSHNLTFEFYIEWVEQLRIAGLVAVLDSNAKDYQFETQKVAALI